MRTSKISSSKSSASKTSTITQPQSNDTRSPTESYSQTLAEASPNEADRLHMIAEAAYYRAEHRGFESGHELDDWLAAEAEIVGHSLRRVSSGQSS